MAYVIIILPFQKYSDILLYLGVVELLYAEHFEIQVGPRDLPLLIKCEQSDPSHFQEDTLRTKQWVPMFSFLPQWKQKHVQR